MMTRTRRQGGQIGLIESVMVLVVFFFLLAGGLVIYQGWAKRGGERRAEEALGLRALRLAQTVTTLPELQCSSGNVVQDSCIDMLKARALANVVANNPDAVLYYYDMFLESRITVEQVYPDNETFIIYDGEPDQWDSIEAIRLPITLYNPTGSRGMCLSLTGGCDFGVIIVEVYG